MAADGMEVSAGGGGGGGNKQPQISMVGLFLACMVAGGVQYGWALQLSLLTPYVQVCMQTYIYVTMCVLLLDDEYGGHFFTDMFLFFVLSASCLFVLLLLYLFNY
jgi:hypothetical protein